MMTGDRFRPAEGNAMDFCDLLRRARAPIAGGQRAYFYAQTEEQEKVQPASVSVLAAMYTSNNSRALAMVQQNYWKQDRWRFTGAVGAADLRLSLIAPAATSGVESLDWRVDGGFFLARLSRNLTGNWYGGGFTRIVDANQSLEFESGSVDFDTSDVRSVGIGLTLEFDSRDMPINRTPGVTSRPKSCSTTKPSAATRPTSPTASTSGPTTKCRTPSYSRGKCAAVNARARCRCGMPAPLRCAAFR